MSSCWNICSQQLPNPQYQYILSPLSFYLSLPPPQQPEIDWSSNYHRQRRMNLNPKIIDRCQYYQKVGGMGGGGQRTTPSNSRNQGGVEGGSKGERKQVHYVHPSLAMIEV